MTKLVQLTLSKITYTGDSIGDDIRIEIECMDRLFGLNKKVKNGSEVAVNAEIGQFLIDETSSELPVKIKVIERDLVFNDVGSAAETINVETNNATHEISSTIEIEESRGYRTKKKATFVITIEVQLSAAVLYIVHQEGGWTPVRREDTKAPVGLATHVKVQYERSASERQYFTIAEGVLQGVKASVKIEPDGTSHLRAENPHTDSVYLTYSPSKKTLELGNKVYVTREYKAEPWKKGLYDIEIPDFAHEKGRYYLNRATLALVWFRIGHNGDRYLHTGTNSLGCVTLTEVERWDELCKILLKARKGDGKSIGVLEVID